MLRTKVVQAQSLLAFHQERHERRFDGLPDQLMLEGEVVTQGDTDRGFEDSLRVFDFDDEGRVV